MNQTFTKKLLLTAAMTVFGLAGMLAQQLNTTGLYRHGTNSASGGSVVATEATDSVTLGATMDYFVMPDPLYNPSYVAATSLTANLVSTFTWSSTPAATSIATKTGFGQNYVTVTWPSATGDYSLKVIENGSAGCDDPTGRIIPVRLINKPTANFNSATSTVCSATPGSVTFTLPLSLSTDITNDRIFVSFQVVFTPAVGAPTTNTYSNVPLLDTGSINLETLTGSALAHGKYEVTITSVSDHVSTKSNVAGVIGATPKYTYNLIRLPQTGEIYHIPNI